MSESTPRTPRLNGGAANTPSAALGARAGDALQFSGALPIASADAARATASFTTNRLLTEQIRSAHALGELARSQSNLISEFAHASLPFGPFRDAVVNFARAEAAMADTIIGAANRFGREFGHIAFAFR